MRRSSLRIRALWRTHPRAASQRASIPLHLLLEARGNQWRLVEARRHEDEQVGRREELREAELLELEEQEAVWVEELLEGEEALSEQSATIP